MKTLNPILALAGAAAANGNTMFARDLLTLDRGHRDAIAIRKNSKRLAGLSPLSVAVITDRNIRITTRVQF